jgi:hypothetical protein
MQPFHFFLPDSSSQCRTNGQLTEAQSFSNIFSHVLDNNMPKCFCTGPIAFQSQLSHVQGSQDTIACPAAVSILHTSIVGVSRNTKSIQHMPVFTGISEVNRAMLDNRAMFVARIHL